MREVWEAGGIVYMLEVGCMAREEAKLAIGSVIDAFGKRKFCHNTLSASHIAGLRNLANEVRGLSYVEGKNYADDRRSFAQLGTHLLTLLHTALLNGNACVLNSHE